LRDAKQQNKGDPNEEDNMKEWKALRSAFEAKMTALGNREDSRTSTGSNVSPVMDLSDERPGGPKAVAKVNPSHITTSSE
jgi:hypothetical protein